MRFKTVTAPTTEPVSLAEAARHLRLEGCTDEYPQIADWIMSARAHVESYTRRSIAEQTVELTTNGFPDGDGKLSLKRPPLKSVSSVTYTDTDGNEQTMTEDTDFRLFDDGEVFPYLRPMYDADWPDTRDDDGAVKVRYVTGYTTVPAPIRSAMLMLIAAWYEGREPYVTGTIVAKLPFAVEALLEPYRIMEVR